MKENKQSFGKAFYMLIIVQFLTSAAYYIVGPILTKYLIEGGMTVALAGTVSGMISLTALCVRPFSGVLADKISPKKILMIAIPLLALSSAGYSISTAPFFSFFFRIMNGIAFCLNGTTIIAFSCKFIPEERMSEGIGYQGLGNVLASALCPGIGLAISRKIGYGPTFYVAAAMAVAGLLILLPIKDEEKTKEISVSERKKLDINDLIAIPVLPIALLSGIFSFTNGTVTYFMVLVTEENNLTEISMYYTVIAATMLILRSFAGRLCDKRGVGIILIPAYLLTAAGNLIISHTSSAFVIAATGILMAFGQGGGSPALLSESVKKVSPERRGVATGTYYIFLDVFQGFSPILGGALVTATGTYKAPFALAASLLIAGLVTYLLLGKKIFGDNKTAAETVTG